MSTKEKGKKELKFTTIATAVAIATALSVNEGAFASEETVDLTVEKEVSEDLLETSENVEETSEETDEEETSLNVLGSSLTVKEGEILTESLVRSALSNLPEDASISFDGLNEAVNESKAILVTVTSLGNEQAAIVNLKVEKEEEAKEEVADEAYTKEETTLTEVSENLPEVDAKEVTFADLKNPEFVEAHPEYKEVLKLAQAFESGNYETLEAKLSLVDSTIADNQTNTALLGVLEELKRALKLSDETISLPYTTLFTGTTREANGLINYAAAEPEKSESIADANNSVHGYAGVITQGDINLPLKGKQGEEFKPIQGIKVYFQWFEDGGRVSPVYYSTSGPDGQFHILAKPYLAPDGELIKFDSDPTVSGGHEKYRLWVDKTTIPEGYALHYITGEQVAVPYNSSLTITAAGSGQSTTKNTWHDVKVLLRKLPGDLMHRKDATETEARVSNAAAGGTIEGRVGWDYSSGAGGVEWKMIRQIDSPAAGVTVRGSYLSDYAMKKIYSLETVQRLGLNGIDDIRGSKWTPALEDQLQTWIQGEVKKDPTNWIAETVTAKTNAEGKYVIQFKGTWGYLPNKDSVKPNPGNKWTPDQISRLGTVAKSATEGSFDGSPLKPNRKADVKHINWEWLYVSVDDTEDLIVTTPFNYNYYTGSNDKWGFHSGWNNNNITGLYTTVGDGVINAQRSSFRADFTLAPQEINFHITNYDSVNNLASVGDVAETSTTGLPYSKTSDQYRIVWYNEKGDKVKEGPVVRPNGTGALDSVSFDTKDVTETTEFTAKLFRVGNDGKDAQLLAVDSFTVDVKSYIGSLYDDFELDNEKAVKNATYKAENLPDGLQINSTNGNVTGKPTKAGVFSVKTTVTVNDKDAGEITGERTHKYLITDSPLADGAVNAEYNVTVKPQEAEGYVFKNVSAKFITGKEIEGLNIAGDKITGTPTKEVKATQDAPNVEVTYDVYRVTDGVERLIKKNHVDKVPLVITTAKDSTEYEPNYEDQTVEKGQSITATPTFTKGGQETQDAPVQSFALGENAPDGARINEHTGEVTYTPTDNTPAGEVNIPVKVTYNDNSTDDANLKVTVKERAKTDVEGTPTEVTPDGGKQETGLTVKNKDDKTPTTVEAKDEDGQNVPVEIGEDGKIKVTPPA
ncbi:MAG: Rib/alpha-like domain-containing protein, partial [Peptoniphilaceae bacterium]|nr:Rib/alpha-like domain-containing protein [Peptoniphilaceae bacterium]